MGKEGGIYTASFQDGSVNIKEWLYQTLGFQNVMDVIIVHFRYKWLFFIPPPPPFQKKFQSNHSKIKTSI